MGANGVSSAVGWAHSFGPAYSVNAVHDDRRKLEDGEMLRVVFHYYPDGREVVDSIYIKFDEVFDYLCENLAGDVGMSGSIEGERLH